MKKSTFQTLDTGSLLTAYCKKEKVHKAALARKMGIEYKSVFYYLKTNSMDLQKLMDFSHALNHNFLLDLAAQLPASYSTDAPVDTAKDEENMHLKEQIKILEAEKEILLRAFGRQ